jgi:hypothetical protein
LKIIARAMKRGAFGKEKMKYVSHYRTCQHGNINKCGVLPVTFRVLFLPIPGIAHHFIDTAPHFPTQVLTGKIRVSPESG